MNKATTIFIIWIFGLFGLNILIGDSDYYVGFAIAFSIFEMILIKKAIDKGESK